MRKNLLQIFVGSILLFSLASCSQKLESGSVQAKEQTPDQSDNANLPISSVEQAVGFYTSGNLVNQNNYKLQDLGLVKIFQPRNRGFTTSDLMTLVGAAAKKVAQSYPGGERMQVGDSAQSGGGQVSGHQSHQNGLDVDLVYYRNNHYEQDVNETSGFVENFVDGQGVTANFDLERNWFFVKQLVASGKVNRIFMDVSIKRALCKYADTIGEKQSFAETLRHIRPWPNHFHHMHVRITCPNKSQRCVQQDPPPEGHGCDDLNKVTVDSNEVGC